MYLIKNKKKNVALLAVAAIGLNCAAFTANVQNVRADNISENSVNNQINNVIPAKSYGVDVSSWQKTDLTPAYNAGAKYAIVKTSEGVRYENPNANGQINSANKLGMGTLAYHFATFSNNKDAAINEANYAISIANKTGIKQGSYLALDWENGDGNNISGDKNTNTDAILAFMDKITTSGYQPMLYSGAYALRNNVDTNKILAKYPNSLWVASYKTLGRTDNPDYKYFPSMNGVAIWQFTNNWNGQNVDGNTSVLPLILNKNTNEQPSSQAPAANVSTENNNRKADIKQDLQDLQDSQTSLANDTDNNINNLKTENNNTANKTVQTDQNNKTNQKQDQKANTDIKQDNNKNLNVTYYDENSHQAVDNISKNIPTNTKLAGKKIDQLINNNIPKGYTLTNKQTNPNTVIKKDVDLAATVKKQNLPLNNVVAANNKISDIKKENNSRTLPQTSANNSSSLLILGLGLVTLSGIATEINLKKEKMIKN